MTSVTGSSQMLTIRTPKSFRMIVSQLICLLGVIRFGGASEPSVHIPNESEEVTIQGRYENTSIYGDRPVYGPKIDNDGNAIESFIGIPFAEKPIGDKRFSKVELLQANSSNLGGSTFDATTWSPGCMAEYGMFTTETDQFSEDCLYLNVFRRKGTKEDDKKPVIVILYGGGYSAGDTHEYDWRGNQLAYFGDVVVVSFNYRLGMFGFLDFDLPGEAEGNMGHHDQVLALQWVNRYIRYFGGDPDRVTLFGMSAGSFSISTHLITGDAHGLFHAAVIDAGVPTFFHFETSEQQLNRMTKFAELTGCEKTDSKQDKLACLRSLSEKDLLKLQTDHWSVSQTYTFRPTYHSVDLPDQPECYVDAGKFAEKVPIIIGDTTNEGLFLLTEKTHDPPPKLSSPDELMSWTHKILANHHATNSLTDDESTIKEVYNITDGASSEQYDATAAQIIGDCFFVCPVMHYAKQYSKNSGLAYLYRWDRIRDKETMPGEKEMGAYHGLMFMHGAGGQYLYLGNDVPQTDADYIFWTLGMIVDLAKDSTATPKFDDKEIVKVDDGEVNNFNDEKLTILQKHPKESVCSAVYKVPSESCPTSE